MASRLVRSRYMCSFFPLWTHPTLILIAFLLLVIPALYTYTHHRPVEGKNLFTRWHSHNGIQEKSTSGYAGLSSQFIHFSEEDSLPKQPVGDGVRHRRGKTHHPSTQKIVHSDIATTGVIGDAGDEPTLKRKGTPVAITHDSNVSRMLTAFTLRNQLPNYFIHGDAAGLAEKYREGNMAYVHNVKSGGETMKDCIEEICRDHNIPTFLIYSGNRVETFKKYEIEAGTPNQTIFTGDGTFNICEYLRDRPCSYFTMVREPVSRLISYYLFCQQSGAGCTDSSVNVSLEAWALYSGSMLFHSIFWHFIKHFPLEGAPSRFQHQSAELRVFAEELQQKYPGIVTGQKLGYRMTYGERHAFLSHCLENLENWFAVIGLTEEFNTSVDLYQEVYRLPFRDYYHGAENIGRIKQEMDPSKINKMKEDIRANPLIMEVLYEDIKIYEKAQEIMEIQKQAFGLV